MGCVISVLLFLVISTERVFATRGGLPLSISFDPPADRVRLGAPLTVRCELASVDTGSRVQGPVTDGVSMLLHCPIAPWGSFCFLNCKSACADEEPGKCPFLRDLGNVSCQKIVTQEGLVRYEYKIPRLTKQWLTRREAQEPGFYCRSAGLKTPEVWLTASKDSPPPAVKPVPVETHFTPKPDNPPPAEPSKEESVKPRPPAVAGPSADNSVQPAQPKLNGETRNEAEETIVIPKSDLEAKMPEPVTKLTADHKEAHELSATEIFVMIDTKLTEQLFRPVSPCPDSNRESSGWDFKSLALIYTVDGHRHL
ncbi:unnamed protein product [Echinostoma caproni]|uniref:Ig-like domain-containing protein n=1 Tax=Echinostoma caproni TaxID=27848 RepID=A0A183AA60_9TREM|nr:unnamed protein product [Echinostoma caproni]